MCIREIQLNAIGGTIVGLVHAIQLDGDRFIICATKTTLDRVCIIDSNGRMMKSYGGGRGSGIGQMNRPCYLAIDRNGFILVADFSNNRIIQLNASLEFIREFIPGSGISARITHGEVEIIIQCLSTYNEESGLTILKERDPNYVEEIK